MEQQIEAKIREMRPPLVLLALWRALRRSRDYVGDPDFLEYLTEEAKKVAKP